MIAKPVRKGRGLTEVALCGFVAVAFGSALIDVNPSPSNTIFKAIALTGALLAIGRLVIRRARFGTLEVDELKVRRLRVLEPER